MPTGSAGINIQGLKDELSGSCTQGSGRGFLSPSNPDLCISFLVPELFLILLG